MKKIVLIVICIALSSLISAQSARAQGEATANLNVSLEIGEVVTVAVTQDVNFGTLPSVPQVGVDPEAEASGQITVTAPSGQAYEVGFDAGTAYDASNQVRRMNNGVDELWYQLYDTTLSWILGTENLPSAPTNSHPGPGFSGSGIGSAQAYDISAFAAGETGNESSGLYSDVVTVIVQW